MRAENGGAKVRRLLEAVASLRGVDGKTFIAGMIERGELLTQSNTKRARYGLPRVRFRCARPPMYAPKWAFCL